MSLAELACRSRQSTARLFDRVAPAFRPDGQPRRALPRLRGSGIETGLRANFAAAAPMRFFAGASDQATSSLAMQGFDESSRATIAAADRVRAGCFDLLGYERLSFGDEIDWHRDPVSGRRAPDRHWSRIDPLNDAEVGDSKVIWELNRHQWLVTLAQAYRLTGDPTYAECALDRVEAWIAANPYPRGVNWASSLEAALRLIAWCWALMLLLDAPPLTDERFARWQQMIRAHAAHIERYLSYYFSPNTHLTGEALGLVYAGIVFAGLPEAARWRDLGRRVLVDELRRQVTADGVYFEQATCYHRYTLEIYLHLLLLAERNRLNVPDDVRAVVSRMTHALVALTNPDRAMPGIGDADGGWILPLAPRAPRDCRGVLSVAAVVFNQPEFAWAAGGPAPELVWLFGADGLESFARLRGRTPTGSPSRVFKEGGYAVMRSGWQGDAHQLTMDVGPLGCPISGAHGHADLLSVQCSAFGEDYIVDAGTYCYTGDRVWRDHFRSTSAHNTVVIDSVSQAESAGPFSWRHRPSAKLLAWESTDTHDFVDAVHHGYRRLRQPVDHRRRVLFVKHAGWVVVDDIAGDGEHDIEVRFQFSPRAIALDQNLCARVQGRRSQGLWIVPISDAPLGVEIREGSLNPIDGWISTAYGTREPAPLLIYRTRATTPVRITTVIIPAEPLSADMPVLDVERDESEDAVGFRFPHDDRRIRVTADALTIDLSAGRLRIA